MIGKIEPGLAVLALASATLAGGLIEAAYGYWSLTRSETLQAIRELTFKLDPLGEHIREPNLGVECVKAAAVKVLPSGLALLAAIGLRRRRWKGIAIVLAAGFAAAALLHAGLYGRPEIVGAIVAGLVVSAVPAADLLIREPRAWKRIALAVGLAVGVQIVGRFVELMVENYLVRETPHPAFGTGTWLWIALRQAPLYFLSWIPLFLAWFVTVPQGAERTIGRDPGGEPS